MKGGKRGPVFAGAGRELRGEGGRRMVGEGVWVPIGTGMMVPGLVLLVWAIREIRFVQVGYHQPGSLGESPIRAWPPDS